MILRQLQDHGVPGAGDELAFSGSKSSRTVQYGTWCENMGVHSADGKKLRLPACRNGRWALMKSLLQEFLPTT